MMKAFRALGRAALAALILSGFGAPAALAASKEKLTIGLSQFPSTLHPNFDSMLAKSYINAMARRLITVHNADWEVICVLCLELPDLEKNTARFEMTPDGKPGLAVDYSLDPRAVWADGTPMTTKDIKFTWEVGRHPETGIDNVELFRRILSIDVHDDHRFTLHLDRRSCDYQGINGFEILPEHVEAAAFTDPANYRKQTFYDRDPTNPGLWFGPYKIKQVVNGDRIILDRNPRWWGKSPFFDEIEVRVIENTAALTANLLAGDIDMIAGESGISIDQALSFERRHGDDFQIIYRAGLVYEHLDVNLDSPILGDVAVRQALIQGIDRQAISERLFQGKQPVAHGQVHPLDSVHYDRIPRYGFDPEKAGAALDAAGWTMGPNGIRQNAEGTPFQFELITTAGNKTRELVQQVLQSQWREIGVDVRLRNEPPRVLFGETIAKRKFTGMAMFAWLSSPQNIPRTTLHSEMIPTEENAWAGQNYTGYNNPRMDTVIDDLELVCEEEANQALWQELQTTYATDLPAIPLYFRSQPFILPKNLTGLTPTGHQYSSTHWVEEWAIAE